MSTTNLEEAASIAAEYVSSLDNLPQEVQFLLAEMKHKDTRTQELQQEINTVGAKYIRHSVKSANGTSQLSTKDANIPTIVKTNYAEIDRLAVEKEKLAERIVQLINRARARLEHDLHKVLVLQGEVDPSHGMYSGFYGSRNPVSQVLEVLKNSSSSISIADTPSTPTSTATPTHPNKRRKTAAAPTVSIKLPSPAPVATSSASGGGSSAAANHRSRLSQQVARQSPARQQRSSGRAAASAEMDVDEDAEGEEDLEDNAEDNGEVEDKELYCFCQKLSYGEMVACDNPSCRYQWFHLPCVSLKPPLPHVWYCSECASQFGGVTTTAGAASGSGSTGGGGGSSQRKGRKK
ncbi:hypothetical protein QCA50_000870 [Cerrena zonata]|uniref:Chromatin modification-related protein n=1 Tax=Cerrena zonata TaxID=2478898 RepID=A0AAW0GU20_9APHY